MKKLLLSIAVAMMLGVGGAAVGIFFDAQPAFACGGKDMSTDKGEDTDKSESLRPAILPAR